MKNQWVLLAVFAVISSAGYGIWLHSEEVVDEISSDSVLPAPVTRDSLSHIPQMSNDIDPTSSPMVPLGLPEPPMPNDPPGPEDRAEYMIGTVAVTTIFPESNGAVDPNSETWNQMRMDKVYSEIYAGLDWWEAQMPNGRLQFNVYTLGKQDTSYEPITRSWTNQFRWVGEILNNLGYTSGDYVQDAIDLNNDVRNTYGADWAYTAFIVDSFNDADGTFSDGVSGYAYGLGGPFMVMTYDNNGWGVDNMDKVMAHETGHMFYATDEYTRPGEWSGYLNILEQDNSGCLMDTAAWCLSTPTKHQVGWRDSDSDGIMDPEDTIPNSILDPQMPDPTTTNVLTYTGTAEEIALTNQNPAYDNWLNGHRVNAGNDVSINVITLVQYRIDGGPWMMTTAMDGAFDEAFEGFTFTTAAIPDGTHMIETRARNTVGNWEDTYSSDIVTVDTTPPVTTVLIGGTSGTNGWYRTDVTIALIGNDATSGVQYTRYKLNGGAWQIYVGPFPVNGDGIITLEYHSVDNVDLVEGTKNRGVKIDKAVPSTSEGVAGSLGVNGYYTSEVTVTLSATDIVSGILETKFSVDGGPFQTYVGPFNVSGDWTHSILYYSADIAGNTEGMNSFDVMIDATDPFTGRTLSGTLGNNNWYLSSVDVTLNPQDSASGVNVTKYRINGGTWLDYVGPFQVTGNGLHDVEFYSGDYAGNVEGLNAVLVRIDMETPSTGSTPSGTVGTMGWFISNVTFDLAGTDVISGVSDIQYRVDGQAWQTYMGSFLVSGEGGHTVEYFSVDVAGNTETTQSVQVKIDTQGPATTDDVSGPAGSGGWYTGDVTIALTSSDVMSGVMESMYRVDGGPWRTYSLPFSISSDGSHTVDYYSLDNASNAESTRSISMKIDTEAPGTTDSVSGIEGDNDWYTGNVAITLSGSDSMSGVQATKYRIDGESWQDLTGSISLTSDGEHTVEYYSVDVAGNAEIVQTLEISIDDTVPEIATLTLADLDDDGVLKVSSATVQWTGSDATSGIDHYEVKVDNGGYSEIGTQGEKTFGGLGDGSHTITVKAVDKAGNVWEEPIEFSVDSNTLSPSGPLSVLIYVLLIIVAVIVALTLFLWRRRKREEPEEQ